MVAPLDDAAVLQHHNHVGIHNVTSYSDVFKNVATKSGTIFTVNYTSSTESLVDKMIATKSSGANVVKGTLVE